MAKNTIKVKGKLRGSSLFSKFENLLKIDNLFESGLPLKYVPYILFVMMIGIFYIGNTHYAEKTIRDIGKLQRGVEDLRADFTTLKAEYMFASKQSEVAKRVKVIKLEESLDPPHKIIINDKEN